MEETGPHVPRAFNLVLEQKGLHTTENIPHILTTNYIFLASSQNRKMGPLCSNTT